MEQTTMSTIYASFPDALAAERAAAALLDHGALPRDLSVVESDPASGPAGAIKAEKRAKEGLSTTTPADAAAGAVKGTMAGLGIGIAAALAAMLVPGVGLVLGGGALAAAAAGAAGTTVAGTAAGGIAGYLRDQGVADEMITQYSHEFERGGAIIAVAVPTADLDGEAVERVLVKYGARNVATYNAARMVQEDAGEEYSTDLHSPILVDGDTVTLEVVDPLTGTTSPASVTVAGRPISPGPDAPGFEGSSEDAITFGSGTLDTLTGTTHPEAVGPTDLSVPGHHGSHGASGSRAHDVPVPEGADERITDPDLSDGDDTEVDPVSGMAIPSPDSIRRDL
jgi:hypothetical protein